MLVRNDLKLDYQDVLLKPQPSKVNSRKDVSLTRNYTFLHSKEEWIGIPIIAANMKGVGTLSMASAFYPYRMNVALCKDMEERDVYAALGNLDNLWPSFGIKEGEYDKLMSLYNSWEIDRVCIDVANGYTEKVKDFICDIREKCYDLTIMAGNVATPEGTEDLIKAGADIVKVGIGPGSVCTTRKMTGVGVPQLSAVMECAKVAHSMGAHIVADGGCTCPGDIAKAFAAGADFVMLGGMLAGHDEGEGYIRPRDATVEFSGSSEYEGKDVRVPYKGPVNNTVETILQGLRSACTYVGANSLSELHEKAEFIRVNHQMNEVFY